MKRFVSLLLAAAMISLLVSCGNQTAEKYCTHCGSGIAKNDAFCAECGAAVGGSTSSSSTAYTDKTTTATDTTTSTAAKHTTTTAKHTTTTTAKHTTTTTTKARQTTTTTAAKSTTATTAKPTTVTTTTATIVETVHKHTYSKYVCTGCGEIDKAHAYEYLLEWTKQNGKTDGTNVRYEYFSGGVTYCLSYSAQSDSLYVYRSEQKNGSFIYCSLYLDDYSYFSAIDDATKLFGFLTPSNFTSKSPISYVNYTGDSSIKYDVIELSRLSIYDLIDWLDWVLDVESIGISLTDLGFLSWE